MTTRMFFSSGWTAHSLCCFFALLFSVTPAGAKARASAQADLVVYGGTASGVVTAYSAAKEGLSVILLEPGTHLGGMVTGGLSATDTGNFHIVGGYARDFYREAAAHYGVTSLDRHDAWLSEPHVGEDIFRAWVKTPGLEVHFHARLREQNGVQKTGTHIDSITTEDGRVWRAKVFADCSYEGDVMAQAKVTYTVGRESMAVYGESLAGVRVDTPKHQFLWDISPRSPDGRLMPEVSAGPMGENGAGDKNEQAYNFRMILTDDPANRLPWTRPAGYDAHIFDLMAKYLAEWPQKMHRAPALHDVTNPVAIPNHKADFNNNGAFSTDYIGHSLRYPDGSYALRKQIWDAHLLYTQAFFWFLASDPRVPQTLRDEVNAWGRAKDEFLDTDGWPNQLYIREGRRMVGQYVMQQKDLQQELTKPDSIAMGSYNSDSHNLQRVATPDGFVRNEGDVQVSVKPYEIAYRSILPKASETENLLVPVCLSASHVAYSSVRMEPQYMMIGQAAGLAAAISVRKGIAVGRVDASELQDGLHRHGAILHMEEQAADGREMH